MMGARRAAAVAMLALLSGVLSSQAQSAGNAESGSVAAFIEIERPHVYVNERFDLTLVIESYGVQLAQSMQLQPGPEQDQLVTEDFVTPPEERRIRDGKVFIRRRFRCSARATQAGRITIAPSLVVTRLQRVRAFIGTAWSEKQQVLRVKPHLLTVKPIPKESQPESWSGAVGVFRLVANATPSIVAPGDLITLRTEIRGRGHTEGMQFPNVASVPDFKAYAPKRVSESPDSRIFTQIVIPQSTNAAAVPPVSFCFFDPLKGQFQTVTEGPFPLTFQSKTIAEVERFTPEDETGRGAAIEDAGQDSRESVRRAMLALGGGLIILCTVACGINVFRKRRARAMLWLCGVFLFAGSMWRLHSSSLWNPDTLPVARDTAARVAPSPGALICAELSEGADISVVERHGTWVRVRYRNSGGWIPADAVDRE